MRRLFLLSALSLSATLVSCAALADDWLVTKARGTVLQLVDGGWQPLRRGDVVSDDRVLRTLALARAELTRGAEVIDLGPNTQVQIHDEAGQMPFTTVQEYFGAVGIDAEVRNVKHFAVQTPFVAAVVKGTHFEVFSDDTGSTVNVDRGHVWVSQYETRDSVVIAAGQSASAGTGVPLEVGGALGALGAGLFAPTAAPPAVKPPAAPQEAAPAIIVKGKGNTNGNAGNVNSNAGGEGNGRANGLGNGDGKDGEDGNGKGKGKVEGKDNKGKGENNGKGNGSESD